MQGALPDSRVMRRAVVKAPQYEARPGGFDAVAQFPSGPALRVDRGRERRYPGLSGESPPTLSLYEEALRVLGGARRVLDAGCGAGMGSQLLCQSVPEVIAVDKSQLAVSFTRHLAPDARIHAADLMVPLSVGA